MMGKLGKGRALLGRLSSALSPKKKDKRSVPVDDSACLTGSTEVSFAGDNSICDSEQFSGSSHSRSVDGSGADSVAFDPVGYPERETSSECLDRKKKVIVGQKKSVLVNIKGALQSSNELVQTLVSPGFLSALLAAVEEEGALPASLVTEIISHFQRAEDLLTSLGDGRSSQDPRVIRGALLRIFANLSGLLSPFAGSPGGSTASIASSCSAGSSSFSPRIALAHVLLLYVRALSDEVKEVPSGKMRQFCEDSIAKCRRYVCALSLYSIFRNSSGALKALFSNANALLNGSSTAVASVSSLLGLSLSPEDLQALRDLAADPGNAADAGNIHGVIGACGTGNFAAARASAEGINNAQIRETVRSCIERAQQLRSNITGIPGSVVNMVGGVSDLVAGISSLLGLSLSPEDLQALRDLAADPGNAADAGNIHGVIGACSTGNFAAARAAAEGINNAQTRETVRRCIERAQQLYASVRQVPGDIAHATSEVRRVVAQSEGLMRGLREALGLNGLIEDLITSTGNLYTAVVNANENPRGAAASIASLLNGMQVYSVTAPLEVAAAASNPDVIASCTASRRESGPLHDGSSSRQVVESVLGSAFTSLFGGVYPSSSQPIKSLSAVYLLVAVLENPESTSVEISDAVLAARSEVLDFIYAVNVLKERHFNTAANGMRHVVDASAEADNIIKKVGLWFGPRVIFCISSILGMVLGALACVGIPNFKDFSISGVASMVMLCAGIVLLGAAFAQACRRSPTDPKQSRSTEVCRGVFCALIPGLAFFAAAVVSSLRLIGEDTLSIPNPPETLTLERAFVVAGILCSLMSALVLACFEVSKCEIGSFPPLCVSFEDIKADRRSASGKYTLLDSASVSSISAQNLSSLPT
ncbi:conserved hypothetical protein [Neorickettsia risticii str. Illinois]|uniref:Uncharacterized protein n=1 Tax=Neorickettsia risticii (strain Illinois) TaxID=434131 RepID=C6V5B5_NEORI|nr:conserved hypothetical protein [Neorickettsia risticii str. Illinois]